jgi:hypothetical protein
MAADVAQRGRAEERVGDGVQQRIGVGMAQQALLVRDGDAAQDQRAAFDQGVAVIALADAEGEGEVLMRADLSGRIRPARRPAPA